MDGIPSLSALSEAMRGVGLPHHAFGLRKEGEGDLPAPAWIAAALPYPLLEPSLDHAEPRGWVASFAARHWYRILADRLMAARDAIIRRWEGPGAPGKADLRVLVNSRLPEKPLAMAAGLGMPGRHSLIIHPELGPNIVLGILLLPFLPLGIEEARGPEPSISSGPPLSSSCRSCSACLRACPTGAILPGGGILIDRCLQHRAGRDEALPDWMLPLWGHRIWGCDDCLRACVRAHPRPMPEGREEFPVLGEIGGEPPLAPFLLMEDAELSSWLRGSALGMKWIALSALRRNAILALGAHGRAGPELMKKVLEYEKSDHPAPSQAARWSLARLNAGTGSGN